MEFENRKRLYLATKRSKDELHYAAYYGDFNTLELLLRYYGQTSNHRDPKGNTPLIAVVVGMGSKKTKIKMIDALMSSGTNINATNDEGNSILHAAVKTISFKKISMKIIRLLIGHGADRTLRNKAGKTASELAFEMLNEKLGTFLLFYNKSGAQQHSKRESKLSRKSFSKSFPTLTVNLLKRLSPTKIPRAIPMDEKELHIELLKVQKSREYFERKCHAHTHKRRRRRRGESCSGYLSDVVTEDIEKELELIVSEVEDGITDLTQVEAERNERREENEEIFRYLVEDDDLEDCENNEDNETTKNNEDNKTTKYNEDNKITKNNEDFIGVDRNGKDTEMLQHCNAMLSAIENLFLMTLLKDRYKRLGDR